MLGGAGAVTVDTGGAAAALGVGVLAIGGVGQIISGSLNIGAAFSGSTSTANGASAVSNVTNPAGLVTSIITGDASGIKATVASSVFDLLTSTTSLVKALVNGLPSSTSDVAALNLVFAPFFAGASSVVNAAESDYSSTQSVIAIYTAPINVTAYVGYLEPVPSVTSAGLDFSGSNGSGGVSPQSTVSLSNDDF